jgi:hypothetical protein
MALVYDGLAAVPIFLTFKPGYGIVPCIEMDVPLSQRFSLLSPLVKPVGLIRHALQRGRRQAEERKRVLANIEQMPCTVESYSLPNLTVVITVDNDTVTLRFFRKPRYQPRVGRNVHLVRAYWNGREYIATGTYPPL